MKRTLRIGVVVLALLLAVPLAAFATYDLIWFQPHRGAMRSLLDSAAPLDRSPPAIVGRLVELAYRDAIDYQVARHLIEKTNTAPLGVGTLRRQMHEELWALLLRVHLPRAERVGLFCTLMYTGRDRHGLSKASADMFARSLDQLSLEEAATIVSLPRSPSRYLASPEALARYRDKLLEKYNNGS